MWLAVSLYGMALLDHRFALRRAPRRSNSAFLADSSRAAKFPYDLRTMPGSAVRWTDTTRSSEANYSRVSRNGIDGDVAATAASATAATKASIEDLAATVASGHTRLKIRPRHSEGTSRSSGSRR